MATLQAELFDTTLAKRKPQRNINSAMGEWYVARKGEILNPTKIYVKRYVIQQNGIPLVIVFIRTVRLVYNVGYKVYFVINIQSMGLGLLYLAIQ